MARNATPMRSFALVRAIVLDPAYARLPAQSQSVVLTAVASFADHDGWFEVKYETLAKVVGRSSRNVGAAMRRARPLIEITPQRRADGHQRANAFRLAPGVVRRADEIVLLWTRGRTKSSFRVGSDEIVTLLGSDEIVLPGTVLNGSMNGSRDDDFVQPSADEAARVRAIVEEAGFPYGGDAT